jgi:hypothetical protein
MRHFVKDPGQAVLAGESAAELFPRMIQLAEEAALPADDIEHMRDFFGMVLLARRYYFQPYDPELADRIQEAKTAYKIRWPKAQRQRYRIKISFSPFPLRSRTLALAAGILLRKKRGYRWVDRVFTLHLAGFAYRALRPKDPAAMPKFFRKSAMGVEVLFK